MTWLLIILLACCAIAICLLVFNTKKAEQRYGSLKDLEKRQHEAKEALDGWNMQIAAATEAFQRLGESIEAAKGNLSEVNHQIEVAKVARDSATELAEKDLALEAEKRRAEFETQLAKEFEEMREKSSAAAYQRLLDGLNDQIEEARQTLSAWQTQQLIESNKEDFVKNHSIDLTEQDLKDIELIRSFAPQLARKEAFFKLIWTEFYQKPLQALCKILNTEKVSGIYRITNITSGRMYIGQAVDIAARWKEHVKCALGIGSTSYLTNKFYKAMHNAGPENFTFEVIELCEGKDNLNAREKYWISFYNSSQFGYNSTIGG